MFHFYLFENLPIIIPQIIPIMNNNKEPIWPFDNKTPKTGRVKSIPKSIFLFTVTVSLDFLVIVLEIENGAEGGNRTLTPCGTRF